MWLRLQDGGCVHASEIGDFKGGARGNDPTLLGSGAIEMQAKSEWALAAPLPQDRGRHPKNLSQNLI